MKNDNDVLDPVILPLETDPTIRIKGYRDNRGIRCVFVEGGFITIGFFRAAYHKANDGQLMRSGPISLTVAVKRAVVEGRERFAVSMTTEVSVETYGADAVGRRSFQKQLICKVMTPEVCDEIAERLNQCAMLLDTYEIERCPTGRRTEIGAPIELTDEGAGLDEQPEASAPTDTKSRDSADGLLGV